MVVDLDVKNHQRDSLHFASDRLSAFDTEINVVGDREIRRYRKRYDIPDSVLLLPSGERAAWNLPNNALRFMDRYWAMGLLFPFIHS